MSDDGFVLKPLRKVIYHLPPCGYSSLRTIQNLALFHTLSILIVYTCAFQSLLLLERSGVENIWNLLTTDSL